MGFFDNSFWTSGFPLGIVISATIIIYTILERRRK